MHKKVPQLNILLEILSKIIRMKKCKIWKEEMKVCKKIIPMAKSGTI
jgi:hypothetical protein